MLLAAKRPLILAGRVSRDEGDWNRRVQLAEALDARVTTNLKVGAAFPTDHPLHIGSPATFVTDDVLAAIKEADAILSLDWVDLAGTLKSVGGDAARRPSSRSRSTRTCTTAGAWTTRACRRSICSSRPSRTPPWRRCSAPSATAPSRRSPRW